MADIIDLEQLCDDNGDTIAGGKAWTYAQGTSTPETTYTDAALTTPHANPIIADAGGRFAEIFHDGPVKIVLRDADDVLVDTLDPAPFYSATDAAAGSVSFSATASIPHNNVQDAIEALAPLASPALTGAPTAPTAASNTSTTQIATTKFVTDRVPMTHSYLTTGTAATYTTPTNARRLVIRGIGGGGGGGGVDGQGGGTAAAASGGGSGGKFEHLITTPAASYTYTIGAGGTGGASGANNGAAGGATTFADGVSLTISAGGGTGGTGATAGTVVSGGGVAGGTTTGAELNLPGEPSDTGRVTGGNINATSNGASGEFGAGGIPGSLNGADGGAASGYGAGGAGATVIGVATNYAGGGGAGGLIIVEVYY